MHPRATHLNVVGSERKVSRWHVSNYVIDGKGEDDNPPSAAVGDRRVIGRAVASLAASGDEHCPAGRTDRHRVRLVVAVEGIAVAPNPHLGPGLAVLGTRALFD